jgi:glucosylceramidase
MTLSIVSFLERPNVRLPLLLLLSGFYFAAVCAPLAAQEKHIAGRTSRAEIKVWEATDQTLGEPQPQPSMHFGSQRAPELTLFVNDATRYQTVDGFGASLTDSSAWLLANKLTGEQRKQLLLQLFDPEKGIGLNLLRQPMGSSDFAMEDYTYDDVPSGESDIELKKFSIEKDERYILPVLKEALAINSRIKVIATPWSAPAWMKSSQSLIQGTLQPDAYPSFANYFVKFVQSYQRAGVPIFAITMQNEPLYMPTDYPSMGMSSSEQAEFLANALGPAFQSARLKTKIFIFDHNWDLIHYPIEILGQRKAVPYVSAIAIHCYGGNVAAQSELHGRFPQTEIWLTECSGGDWQKGNLLVEQVRLIIDSMRNWSHSVILWNLALDQNHQPHLGGCKDCRGVITVKHGDGPSEIVPTVDFTALALASKFVRPGARRISSNTFGPGSLEDVAFRNPDGSVVLLVLNSGGKPVTFNIAWSGSYAAYTLKGASAATFVWQGHRNTH